MIKTKLILIILSIYSSQLFAYKGIIIGLEAPLLQYPNIDSKVLQLVRKGQEVYIVPDPRILEALVDISYNINQEGKRVVYQFDKPLNFYHTLTRTGVDAYIPVSDVKIIYLDDREFQNYISPSDKDSRDYRLKEPLPNHYPFSSLLDNRAQFTFIGSNPSALRYPHQNLILNEKSSTQKGLKITWSTKVDIDKSARFYFGGLFEFHSGTRQMILPNSINTIEISKEFNLGPYATFDLLRSDNYILSVGTSISLNKHNYKLSIEDLFNDGFESRIYSGYSFSSKIDSQLTIKNFLPILDTDFVIGIEGSLNSPVSLGNKSSAENPELFSVNDFITQGFFSKVSLFFGLQARY